VIVEINERNNKLRFVCSWLLGVIYILSFAGIYKITNNVVYGIYAGNPISLLKNISFILNFHWSIFIGIGIFINCLLVFKDYFYSKQIAVRLNYLAFALILLILLTYFVIILMSVEGFNTLI